jgi:hypothetical protein
VTERSVLATKLVAMCELFGISASEAVELMTEAGKTVEMPRPPVPTVAAFLPRVQAATGAGARALRPPRCLGHVRLDRAC